MSDDVEKNSMTRLLLSAVVGQNPRKTLRRLVPILIVGVMAFLLLNFVFLPVQITGPSMSPTFRDGQINFINCLSYVWKEPKRGDIVGIRMAGKHLMYYKRIIGMPGETVTFDDGKVLINGKELSEPYLQPQICNWRSEPKKLGSEDYYFVGDNRSMPFEDHDKGAAPRKRIIGKVLFGGHS